MANRPTPYRYAYNPMTPGLRAVYEKGIRDGTIGHSAPPAGRAGSTARQTYWAGYNRGSRIQTN